VPRRRVIHERAADDAGQRGFGAHADAACDGRRLRSSRAGCEECEREQRDEQLGRVSHARSLMSRALPSTGIIHCGHHG